MCSNGFGLSLFKLGILLSGGDAFSDALKSSMQENLMALYAASTLEVVNYLIIEWGSQPHAQLTNFAASS